jgi:hypothetical protein
LPPDQYGAFSDLRGFASGLAFATKQGVSGIAQRRASSDRSTIDFLMPGRWFLVANLLLAIAGGGCESGEAGAVLGGELTARLDGEPFVIRYGRLIDWRGNWGSRLTFHDVPADCEGNYPDAPPFPSFSAWFDLEVDPESDESWDGEHQIQQNDPRITATYEGGTLDFDTVTEQTASGTLAWGGYSDEHDVTFVLEGRFEVVRCYDDYPGD